MSMTAHDLMQKVANDLPKGCSLLVVAASGHIGVSVRDKNERPMVGMVCSDHRDLEATVLDALSHALAEVQ